MHEELLNRDVSHVFRNKTTDGSKIYDVLLGNNPRRHSYQGNGFCSSVKSILSLCLNRTNTILW